MHATTADWVTAAADVALVAVAIVGFVATVLTIVSARNRQRVEIEGYVRVDVGPPAGTADYRPPDETYVQSRHLQLLGNPGAERVTVSAWYRNLQTHALGVALGVVCKVVLEGRDGDQVVRLDQTHEIAYVEPGRAVRVDIASFPTEWSVDVRVEAVRYKNLNWDGATPSHGRRECHYESGTFTMVPWADPENTIRDRLARWWSATVARVN